MPPEKTRKVRNKVTPYSQKPRLPMDKDHPKTSAKRKTKSKRENLTHGDWLIVFASIASIDNHPSLSQAHILPKRPIDVVTACHSFDNFYRMSRSRRSHK
jgi:hypothetical protein